MALEWKQGVPRRLHGKRGGVEGFEEVLDETDWVFSVLHSLKLAPVYSDFSFTGLVVSSSFIVFISY